MVQGFLVENKVLIICGSKFILNSYLLDFPVNFSFVCTQYWGIGYIMLTGCFFFHFYVRTTYCTCPIRPQIFILIVWDIFVSVFLMAFFDCCKARRWIRCLKVWKWKNARKAWGRTVNTAIFGSILIAVPITAPMCSNSDHALIFGSKEVRQMIQQKLVMRI